MTTEIVASAAYDLNEQIVQCNMNVRANFLLMAALLLKMRNEKLYLALDCKTFEEYLGTLGAEGTRSWLYKLMRCVEVFSKKLAVSDDKLILIGPSKLDILTPMVPAMMLEEHHKVEWLGKAANLSKSDLINEVRLSQGKPIISFLPSSGAAPELNPGLSDLVKYKSYTEYVESRPCILCGTSPVDKSHFPKTKGAGASNDWIIPTCRNCHAGYHLNPLKWMHDYQDKWAAYYYGLILKIWEKV